MLEQSPSAFFSARVSLILYSLHVHVLLLILGLLLLVPALPLAVELFTLSLAALLPARKLRTSTGNSLLAVVIPAHNEQKLISSCIRSLQASATEATTIYVVAHNCSDATAANAAAAGAIVLELNESSGHGKGAALHYGFTHALSQGADGVLVIDADSTVSPNLIPAVTSALQGGSQAVQCRYIVANPSDSARTRLQSLALLGMNVLRPRGRSRLALSCGIFGNGFALAASTLARVPYTAHSVVEDLEYHLLLLRAGIRVDFLDSAQVLGEMPDNAAAAQTQRARWEGGRQLMRRRHALPLLFSSLRHPALLEPALDLLSVPLATGVLFTLAALALAILSHTAWLLICAASVLSTFVLYVLAAAVLGEDPLANLISLAMAPFYLAFKVASIPATRRAARKDATWVRTDRNKES